MRKIAEIEIESLTPSAIGGHKPDEHDDILRGTSIRGLAAWWLRAIMSGRAYDSGDPQHRDKAVTLQKEVFGSTSNSSLITLKQKMVVSKINPQQLIRIERRGHHVDHIRLKLLLMGRRDLYKELERMLRTFKGVISVYSSARSRKYLERETLGLHAIVLSLLLQGLGKGSRRGLGAVGIRKITLSQEIKEFLQERGYNGLMNLCQNGENEYENAIITINEETLRNIINDALSNAGILLRGVEKGKLPPLPDVPSLSVKTASVYIERIEQSRTCEARLTSINKTLEKLFMRSMSPSNSLPDILQKTRRVKITRGGRSITVSDATTLGSYILGLPRAARRPPTDHRYTVRFKTDITGTKSTITAPVPGDEREQYSGFIKFNDKANKYEDYRRPSPIIVSLLDKGTMVITFFKSSDWQDELQWFTSHDKKVTVLSITDAYDEVSRYLDQNFRKVWP